MDTLNSNPTETLVPVENLASSVPGTSTPSPSGNQASPTTSAPEAALVPVAAPAAAPATAPAAAVKMELPQTDGHTVGGWNRFAGYNPNAAKNKPKDGRGGPGGRR